MYTQEQMQIALRNPAISAEYAANLAQTYYEMHNSMARGNPVNYGAMHTINNQLTALVIESGKQIFLTATIDNIQREQARLKASESQGNLMAANTNEAEPPKSAIEGEVNDLNTENVVSIRAAATTNAS